jgi:hypothetical protein
MSEERETAYPLVYGFLAVVIIILFVAVFVRRPNPRVTMILTHPGRSAAGD